MGRGVNKVILIGNLGADPDVRYTPSGNAVANMSLATDESYKDRQTGQVVPRTEWHKVVIFGKLAEIAQQYLKKGSKLYIEGRLTTRKWQDQSGQDRYTTEVVVDQRGTMQMLDSQPSGDQQGSAPADDGWSQPAPSQPGNGNKTSAYAEASGGSSARSMQGAVGPDPQDGWDDDIPFDKPQTLLA